MDVKCLVFTTIMMLNVRIISILAVECRTIIVMISAYVLVLTVSAATRLASSRSTVIRNHGAMSMVSNQDKYHVGSSFTQLTFCATEWPLACRISTVSRATSGGRFPRRTRTWRRASYRAGTPRDGRPNVSR